MCCCVPLTCSLEEVFHRSCLFPRLERNCFDLAHSDTSVEVVAGVPLGLCVFHVALDFALVREDSADGLDLPVGVSSGPLEHVFLVIVLVHDGLVLGAILARLYIRLNLRSELLDGALDGLPVLRLDR